jgi:hypothetical protein
MAITVVSRWKGKQEDALPIAREAAPILKNHGATAFRLGYCHSGPYAGQIFTALIYPDGETYGRAMQALSEHAQYQRLLAEASKVAELQERSVIVTQDL